MRKYFAFFNYMFLLPFLSNIILFGLYEEAAGTQITIEYFNIKSGFEKPVVVNNDDFIGYFIPVFGTTYTVCYNGKLENQIYSHPSGLTGKRYEQGKHDGWDIFGWFDKECRLHLFEDGTYTVQAFRGAGFSNLIDDDDATIYLENPNTTNIAYQDVYAHVTPNQTVKEAVVGQNFKAGDDLGTIFKEPGQTHLHFEVIDQKTGKSIDPIQFWDKGTKTCDKCPPVPEPSTILLFCLGLISFFGVKRFRS